MHETSGSKANTGNTETAPPALSRFWGNTVGTLAKQPRAWSLSNPASIVASVKDDAQYVKDGTVAGSRTQPGAGSAKGWIPGPLMTSTGDRRQGDHRAAGGPDTVGDLHGAWKADEPILREEVDPRTGEPTGGRWH